MESFAGRIAVVTGGGTGMGRELVRLLAAEGCHVAMCDVVEANMAETTELAAKEAEAGVRITSFVADVSDAGAMDRFAEHVRSEHDTDHVHLVFNNAGIAGAGSFVADDPEAWEKTFDVCWRGVYNGCRSFVPMVVASDAGHVVNTASVNGLWASIGPLTPHTAYCAAKFAVRGFTEALITDFRVNAPHVQAHVVMPGHIGTEIVNNSFALHSGDSGLVGRDPTVAIVGDRFRDDAPTSAEAAARIILDGVRAGRWRILVGDDAAILDRMVREDPEAVYDHEFFDRMRAAGGLSLPGGTPAAG